jgi:hypothetical protein
MEMSLTGTPFQTPAALRGLIKDAERRIESLPGVMAAAATFSLPLEGQLGSPFAIERLSPLKDMPRIATGPT